MSLRTLFLGLSFLGLWMLFVFQLNWTEAAVGAAAVAFTIFLTQATLNSVALRFRPRIRWLFQASLLPKMIATDSWILAKDLIRRLQGKRTHSSYAEIHFPSGGSDSRSSARRALVLLFVSMTPNSVVLDVDPRREMILLHHLAPAPVPKVVRRLAGR